MKTIIRHNKKSTTFVSFISIVAALFFLSACAQLGMGGMGGSEEGMESSSSTQAAAQESQPYYPTEFKDLLIPNELSWNRESSMVIKTESFAGGILNFSGRVEINSVADFFTNSMAKNNWRLAGSVKYKNIMLVFTKPHKTCTVILSESEFKTKTEVNVYITDDLGNGAPSSPSSTSIY